MSGPIREELEQHAYRNCIPIFLMIELTLKCNLRCVHCYNFDRDEPLPEPNQKNELSTDEIIRIMDEARDLGTFYLSFTGGEAMAHPDFWQLAEEAIKRRFTLKVLTNGTLIGEEEADRLSNLGVRQISTSFYGASPETHDAVTVQEGSFHDTVEAVRLLRERDMRVLGKFYVMKRNRDEVDEMKSLARDLDMEYSINTLISPRQDEIRDRGPLSTRISTDQLEDLYRNELEEEIQTIVENPPDQKTFTCNCARAVCGITATGDVQPCIGMPISGGNIRDDSFEHIWNESSVFEWIRNLERDDFETCVSCPVSRYCRRSNSQAYLESGSYTGVDEWQCREAELLRDLHHEQKQA